MSTRMILSPTALSLKRFYVVLLCFPVFFISTFISSQTFLHNDSVVFISEDSYLYAESPIYISTFKEQEAVRKSSFKKWSRVEIKTPSFKVSHKKSISSPTENVCYKSSPTGKHSLGLLFNSSSIAIIGSPSPVKLQQKTVPSYFFLLISTRRDQEKYIHITSSPFQIIPITINHFGRPPPVFQS